MNEQHMREAIKLSIEKMREGCGGPFGAVIVKDNQIISRGFNQVTSHCDPTAHAEMVAIRAACESLGDHQLKGCEIYTSCEPCPMCLAAIYWARIDAIYYGNTRNDAKAINFDDEWLYEELTKSLSERTIPIAQLLRNEAQQAFQEWHDKTDKVPY